MHTEWAEIVYYGSSGGIDLLFHLIQLGGSDFCSGTTRHLVGTCMYAFILWFAASRKSSDYYEKTRESYLFQGIKLGFVLNVFMLLIVTSIYITSSESFMVNGIQIHHKIPTNFLLWLEVIYPSVSHALRFASQGIIAIAFVIYLTKETVFHKYYAVFIYVTSGCFYLVSQWWRYVHIDPIYSSKILPFSDCGADLTWHLLGIIALMWPVYVILKERQNWITRTVLFLFSLYFLYEFGKIVDIFFNEQYTSYITSIRHNIDMVIVPILLYIYIKENNLRLEEKTNSVFILADQLETFVRGTVHELRSPVAGIEGIIDILKLKYEKYPVDVDADEKFKKLCPRKQFCNTLYRMSNRMADSIAHISDVLETMSDYGHTCRR